VQFWSQVDYLTHLLRRVWRACPVAVMLALPAAAAPAASPMRFNRLGLDQGLSELAVNVIAQDPAGFLWIGTEDGLDRYDGYRFQHFTQDRANGVPNNFIADIGFDSSGGLWLATDGGGVARRDPQSGRFSTLESAARGSRTAGLDHVRVVRIDRRGRVWIGTRDSGLALFDPATSTLRRFVHVVGAPASLADNSVLAVLEDRRGRVWIGTDAGVDVLEPNTGHMEHHPLSALLRRQPGRLRTRALLEDSRGIIWIGTDAGLVSFDPFMGQSTTFAGGTDDPHSLPPASIEALYEDSEHRLWIGTADGLVRFDRELRVFETYRNDPRDVESLPDNHIVSIFEDRSGLLWVGTKFGGIAKWNPRSWSFGHHGAGAEEGFASRNVMSFTEDHDGRLWIGTFGGGLTAVDADGRALTFRANDPGSGGLGDDRVMALLTARDGSVWAGTMGGGLDLIEAGSHRITHYRHDPADPSSLAASGVMALLEDSKGRIWVGTYGGGLSRFDRGGGSFHNYLPDAADPTRLSNGRVTALAEDRSGRIWAGTDGGGLNVLNPNSGALIRLRHNSNDPHSLSADTVYALHVDATGGAVWIGTRGGGLDRATTDSGENGAIAVANLSEANGLPNNTVYGILPDGAGRLWLSTNHGLACLDPLTGTVSSYHRSHGLQADEFNFGSHYRTRDGRLLFGGANGYNEFYPDRLQFNRTVPPVALTSLLKLGRPMPTDASYGWRGTLHFDYQDDVITFEFAALDFVAPEANSFEYRLDGFDRSWIHAGTLRTATYTHLPGGKYVLHVRAANADGVWNMKGLTVSLDVDPPPWKTWQAYFLYALVAALLIHQAWLRQRRALARAADYRRQLEQEVAYRTRQLADRNAALQRANSKLEEVSFTDALTGLGNRRSLAHAMQALSTSIQRNNRGNVDGSRLALLIVDLDHLKPINDEHGHEAGDRLLIEVAAILNECVRANDKVVRWGGDEFVVVYTVRDLDGAAALAERIRFAVSKRRFRIGGDVDGRTSCSIGFALYPFTPGTPPRWEKVLSVADANLYRAKETRNAWVGCCGTPNGIGIADLESLAERDLAAVERGRYVEVRRSDPTNGETVELFLRRPGPARTRK
jgi:diguanylate cyclase (GGDEF)-like protein